MEPLDIEVAILNLLHLVASPGAAVSEWLLLYPVAALGPLEVFLGGTPSNEHQSNKNT